MIASRWHVQAAWLWLALMLLVWGYGTWRMVSGLPLDSDLLYLLPSEEQDPQLQKGRALLINELGSRFTVMVGHPEEEQALQAAKKLQSRLQENGMLKPTADNWSSKAIELAKTFFPYRQGLLGEQERQMLLQHQENKLIQRAVGQLYNPSAILDSQLLLKDPFTLFSSFLLQLPNPAPKLMPRNGWLHTYAEQKHWFMINAQLSDSPFSIQFQNQFMQVWETINKEPVTLLRLSAIFYAQAAASRAMNESSTIGTLGLLLTILLIIFIFRAVRPLGLTILAILNGLMCGLVVSLLLFERIHTAALLFGSTLIGVAVDYCLIYFCQAFSPQSSPAWRLKSVIHGIFYGMLTTFMGYFCLAMAPFPGLQQGAAISVAGLLTSWLTVVLWFPHLDTLSCRTPSPILLHMQALLMWLWQPAHARQRTLFACTLVLLSLGGALHFEINDNIRRYQQLSPHLQEEQKQIQKLTGMADINQFFWLQNNDQEQLLRVQEQLGDRLQELRTRGIIQDWLSLARFTPSTHRQQENKQLITALYGTGLPIIEEITGLSLSTQSGREDFLTPENSGILAWPLFTDAKKQALFPISVQDSTQMTQVAEGITGAHYVDPAADLSTLLERYRYRALLLLALSVLFTYLLLVWRYGWKNGITTLLPALCATLLTPFLLALLQVPFGFFTAIALVLLFAIGVDYAIFCAEESSPDLPMLTGIWLTALTSLFSFGLLAFSQTPAVREFGLTVMIGISLSMLLAPWAMRNKNNHA
ncbi:MMPL family transporter [Candidatus Magnetaquicoccus inordinatus]|uniref:MMPL family transporter n=1 Tax=Candidatus Magnetaquicoccus inordinatus TaxID=2496818 RepID=UPI00102B4068|nr:hypothetical protein [Candidatus Magnetaquicoccus inordinatus]